MFQCERCGSSYSARHVVALENCPRCLMRERVEAPLAFKAFDLPGRQLRPRSMPMKSASTPTPGEQIATEGDGRTLTS